MTGEQAPFTSPLLAEFQSLQPRIIFDSFSWHLYSVLLLNLELRVFLLFCPNANRRFSPAPSGYVCIYFMFFTLQWQ